MRWGISILHTSETWASRWLILLHSAISLNEFGKASCDSLWSLLEQLRRNTSKYVCLKLSIRKRIYLPVLQSDLSSLQLENPPPPVTKKVTHTFFSRERRSGQDSIQVAAYFLKRYCCSFSCKAMMNLQEAPLTKLPSIHMACFQPSKDNVAQFVNVYT